MQEKDPLQWWSLKDTAEKWSCLWKYYFQFVKLGTWIKIEAAMVIHWIVFKHRTFSKCSYKAKEKKKKLEDDMLLVYPTYIQ